MASNTIRCLNFSNLHVGFMCLMLLGVACAAGHQCPPWRWHLSVARRRIGRKFGGFIQTACYDAWASDLEAEGDVSTYLANG